jgi:hypothetical protein
LAIEVAVNDPSPALARVTSLTSATTAISRKRLARNRRTAIGGMLVTRVRFA